jgi:hypothetical protein
MPKIVGKTSLRLLKSAPTIGKIVLTVVVLVLAIAFVADLPRVWMSERITIASFTDTMGDKSGELGNVIPDVIESEILRIVHLTTPGNPWEPSPPQEGTSPEISAQEGTPPKVLLLEMTGAQIIERGGGKISFLGIELPLDMALQTLKPLLPNSKPHYTITGRLQRFPSGEDTQMEQSEDLIEKDDCLRFPSGKGMLAQLIVRLEEDGRMLKRWSCMARLTEDAEGNAKILPDLVSYLRKIAFATTLITVKDMEANSSKNFDDFIHGVDFFRRYKDDPIRDNANFDRSESFLLNVIENNPKYARAHPILEIFIAGEHIIQI